MYLLFGALLLLKFLLPLRFGVPLGYDAGIYRYLFAKYGEAFPPFAMPDLPPWAREHPVGLFIVTTPLLKLGLPVDAITGWVWNFMPVLLAGTLAWIFILREGNEVGMLVLLTAFLSGAFFDGFVAMYWKTFAALFWMILSFHLLDRKSPWAALTSILVLVTHTQTGLLFLCVLGSFFLWKLWKERMPLTEFPRRYAPLLLFGIGVIALTFLLYGTNLRDAVLQHLPTLLLGSSAPGGNFPPPSFYLRTEGILLLLGFIGLGLSLRQQRYTLWQLAVLWSLLFVVLRLMFYRRFFLHLDFFLLPFAASAIWSLWKRWNVAIVRGSLLFILLFQGVLSFQAALAREPTTMKETFNAIQSLSEVVPKEALLLTLENESAPYLRGWLPEHHVGGPGLFESAWSEEEWKGFLLGSHADRLRLLQTFNSPLSLFISPLFHSYYGEHALRFLQDPCFEQAESPMLWMVREECLAQFPP